MARDNRPKPSQVPGLPPPPPGDPFAAAVYQILNGLKMAGSPERFARMSDLPPSVPGDVVQSQNAAGKTTVDFTSGIGAGYDYELEFAGLRTTDNDEGVRFRVGDSGGFKTTNYYFTVVLSGSGGGSTDQSSQTGAAFYLTRELFANQGLGNGPGKSMRGTIRFSGDDLLSASLYCEFDYKGSVYTAVGSLQSLVGSGFWHGGTGSLNRIQLLTENGNGFTAGIVTLRRKARKNA